MKRWPVSVKGMQLLWLPIPASSGVLVIVWALHATLWTFFLMLIVLAFQSYMRVKGRTVPWLVRRIRGRMSGDVLYARPVWFRRRTQRREGFDFDT